ncbi:MAG: M28 family peptidase [Bacteroidales bacterium]|nr:M28 family peptidase [Bacteroidales bacterium]
MLRSLTFVFLGLFLSNIYSQDLQYVKESVQILSDSSMHGRGYVQNGDGLAATFIRNEMKKAGLKSYSNNYFQHFAMPINTFPDTVRVEVDGSSLQPGKDFVVESNAPAVNGSFELVFIPSDSVLKDSLHRIFPDILLKNKVVVTDGNNPLMHHDNPFGSAGIIFTEDKKVGWHVSNGFEVKNYFTLKIMKDKIPVNSKKIKIQINSKFERDHKTQNVIGYLKGTKEPDSIIVIGAHYDHLGMMGSEVWFPGANDNASGTSMMLDLARYFGKKKYRPDNTIVCIAFAGEEAGLLGSFWFVEHPPFPLSQVKMMINLDMVGSGSEGIKVVNGTILKTRFNQLKKINEQKKYLAKVSGRGEAANSDHYPFYAKGVPAFFIYTLGAESPAYHSIWDTTDNVPFTEYEDLFNLLTDFIKQL